MMDDEGFRRLRRVWCSFFIRVSEQIMSWQRMQIVGPPVTAHHDLILVNPQGKKAPYTDDKCQYRGG